MWGVGIEPAHFAQVGALLHVPGTFEAQGAVAQITFPMWMSAGSSSRSSMSGEQSSLPTAGRGYRSTMTSHPHQSSSDEADPETQSTPAGIVRDLEEEAEAIGATTDAPTPQQPPAQ